MVAFVTGLECDEFIHCMGDTHVYKNHFEAIQTQCERIPKAFPTIVILEEEGESLKERKEWSVEKCLKVMEAFEVSKFKVIGYEPFKTIPMKMSA